MVIGAERWGIYYPFRVGVVVALGHELKEARQVAMAGSTCFHSSSHGRLGFWGTELAGFRVTTSATTSCRRLKFRKKNHDNVHFNEFDGRVARARAVESLETTSPGKQCLLCQIAVSYLPFHRIG